MHVPRFLVPELPNSGLINLPELESHHAMRVLRMKNGADVELFDGAGNVGAGTIVEVGRRDVTVQMAESRFEPNDHFGRVTLAVALPKGDRQRGTIEKLTELGADRLIPLDTVFAVAEVNDRNAGRLERYAIEACKQSRRNRLMQINEPLDMAAFCDEIRSARHSGVPTWVLHPPVGNTHYDTVKSLSMRFFDQPASGLIFAIGPEGGFSSEEVDQMVQAGASMLSLGQRILRVETAVTVACTLGSLWVCNEPVSIELSKHSGE